MSNYLRRCPACLSRSYHGSVAAAGYRTSHCWKFGELAASMGAAVTRGASEVPDTSMLPLLRCTLSANTAHSRVAAVLVDSLRARGVLVLNPATERDTCSGRSKLRRITGFLH